MPRPADVRPGFGPWLAHVRRQHGFGQREFAEILGVGERTVRAWESEEARPSPRGLRLVAQATGKRPRQLIAVDDPSAERA